MLCFHRLHSINMKQLNSLIDNTLLLNKAVFYLSFILEEGKHNYLLFARVSYRIKHPSSGFCFSVHFLFSLIYLVIGFSTGSFFRSDCFKSVSSVSFSTLSLSFSLCVCVCAYLNHALFLCQVFTLSIQMIWYQKVYLHLEWTLPKELQINGLVDVIITRLRWTYADQSVKICYRSKYSGLVSPSQPKSRKCKVRIDPESHSFSRLYEVLCYHALENTDPALEDAGTYMQLIYPLSRSA